MKTNDTEITELMKKIESGEIQLPDFQRGWVWDDNRIKALIASLANNYPVGAAMFLSYDAENNRFKYRTIEGAPDVAAKKIPSELVLDGQQRLTSIYSSLYSKNPVNTRTEKGEEIRRYYYIDISKAVSPNIDREDAIFSVPDDKKITKNFARDVVLDLSKPEYEFEHKAFPLNIILDSVKYQEWQYKYLQYHNVSPDIFQEFSKFVNEIILNLNKYKMPVISLEKTTPKAAVCQVFENVNTGGVSLTVFELVTAVFAMDDFDLRKDWKEKEDIFKLDKILKTVHNTDFLTALTLLSSYKRHKIDGSAISCKKKDVLNLTLTDYRNYQELLMNGFKEAGKILNEERIFSNDYLPYSTQLVPLSVICAVLNEQKQLHITNIKNKIKQWYWCGVFGELYGSANETRYANDMDTIDWCLGNSADVPKTIQDSYFNVGRLLKLQTRQSAAYKGVMALILQHHSKDFISGSEMDYTLFCDENIDIHHIFPRSYCEKTGLPKAKWNSVVNKTPISYSTNREIGGVAPSKYIAKIENSKKVDLVNINSYLESHLINPTLCRTDNFDKFITERAKAILDAIEFATGKTIAGRDSEDVIKEYGESLLTNAK